MSRQKASIQLDISERACGLLKLVVERYIADGQPVGSRTLSQIQGVKLSPASIRNVLAELEALGLLVAPHTSAGRVPTAQGYRFFVDSLLEPQTAAVGEQSGLRAQLLERIEAGEQAASSASRILSGISQLAAVVSVPQQNRSILQRIEFIALAPQRVLAVLVVNQQQVQNRVMELAQPVTPAELVEAANYLNQNYAGWDLLRMQEALRRDLLQRREHLNQAMRRAAEWAEQVVGAQQQQGLAVSGRGNLIATQELLDPEHLRGLFDALDRKRDVLDLLNNCLDADGIRIFIGRESGYDSFSHYSLITAPYKVEGEVAGVLGVIGPQRMDYGRLIPIVDRAARVFGDTLKNEA